MEPIQELALEQLSHAGTQAGRLQERAKSVIFAALAQATAAGLSQRRIAVALGRSQPEVSRLIKLSSPRTQPTSPLSRRVMERRDRIHHAVKAAGASNPRIFGSVARGDDTPESDIDLMIDIPVSFSLVDLARLQQNLEEILEHHVDVVPARGLTGDTARHALREAVEL